MVCKKETSPDEFSAAVVNQCWSDDGTNFCCVVSTNLFLTCLTGMTHRHRDLLMLDTGLCVYRIARTIAMKAIWSLKKAYIEDR